MAELSWRRATVREILLAIRGRIATATALPVERVSVIAMEPDEVPHHTAERDVLLRLENESPQAAIEGGGRYVNQRTRSLAVWCRSRLLLDTRETDLLRLTDLSLGHLALEDDLVDALEGWIPFDSAGNALAGPLSVGPVSRPDKERSGKLWLRSRLDVTFDYTRDLSLPELP